MTINRVLLFAAIVVFLWAMVLGFGFVDDPDLNEDWAGFLCLGLAAFAGSKL